MRTLATVLCTSGLAAEAKVARRAGFRVVVGAGDQQRTVAVVESAVSAANCLVSFGIAGALAPGLRAGDIILSAEVITEDRRWRPEQKLNHQIADLALQIGAHLGPVLGGRAILATEEEKTRAWRETGAIAIDLESAIVARAAEAAGIPFLVLRAVADTATRELPPAAMIPLSEDGTPALARVLAAVLRHPRQIGALVGLARETRRALSALAAPASALHGLLAAA